MTAQLASGPILPYPPCWARRSTRLLTAALLAVAVLVPPLPARAIGCALTGDGTTASPYLVGSAADLALVGVGACAPSDTYRQTADITLSGAWTPIGLSGFEFTGVYDGGGRSISGVDVQGAGLDRQGLFAVVIGVGAVVRDLVLIAPTVVGKSGVGGAVGQLLDGASVIGVEVRGGSVTGSAGQAGGLVGEAGYQFIATYDASSQTSGVIRDSSSSATVVGVDLVGGLVGYVYRGVTVEDVSASAAVTAVGGYGTGGLIGAIEPLGAPVVVRDASASGPVTHAGMFGVGGLIGSVENTDDDLVQITDVSATGAVEGGSAVGGLVGYLRTTGAGATSRITRANADGDVTGTGNGVGGLIGQAETGATSVLDISRTRSSGDVTVSGARANVGGLVGQLDGGLITESFATGDVTATDSSNVGGLVGSLGYDNFGFTGGGTLRDVHAAGYVTGDDHVGGLVGQVIFDSTVTRSLARGLVTAADGNTAGGLVSSVAATRTLTQTGNVWDTGTTGQSASAGDDTAADVAGFATADLQLLATYSGRGWGIVSGWASPDATATPPSVWGICTRANDGYASLRWTGTSATDNDCYEPSVATVRVPTLAVACSPDPASSGATVTCTVTGADPDIDFLWSAGAGASPSTGAVRVDGSGRGTFTFTLGRLPLGATVTVELVAWGVTGTVTVGAGPIPGSIPAGTGGVLTDAPLTRTAVVFVMMTALLVVASSCRRGAGVIGR
jgi:hypothetical protein